VLQRRQPQLLVATPGRLLDLLDSGVLGLNSVNFVVLDEADKMLSVGFEPQLQRLKALLLERQPAAAAAEDAAKPSKKKQKKQKKALEDGPNQGPAAVQVLLFSATLPKAVRQTADAWLKPGHHSVSCSAGADSISRTITQVGHLQGDAFKLLWSALQKPRASRFCVWRRAWHCITRFRSTLNQHLPSYLSPPVHLPDVVHPDTLSLT